MKATDHTGKRFSRLRVISRDKLTPPSRIGGVHPKWICKCDCGNMASVPANNLVSGRTVSCGCYAIERSSKLIPGFKLGWTHHPLYVIWRGLFKRCYDKKSRGYRFYGSRGIKVCERWNDFANFVADMPPRPEGLSIERINSNGDYEPVNCRWANQTEQCNNTRRNRHITHNGKTQTLAQWERELGFRSLTLSQRLNRGWNSEKAITTPTTRGKQ